MRKRSFGALLCAFFVTSVVACGGSDSDPPAGGDPHDGTPFEDAGTGDGGNGDSDGGIDAGEEETPRIEVADQLVRVPLHGSVEVAIEVERIAGAEGEINVRIEGELPKGVMMSETTLTIAEGSSQGTLTFSSNDEVEALFEITSLKLVAEAGELATEATLEVEVAPLVTTLDDDGPGSLRDMIASAPLLAENPTIGFAPSVFTDSGSPHVIELSSELVIEKGLRIEAALVNDEPRIIIDANAKGRALFIAPTEASQKIELVGVAITGGASDDHGGCIRSDNAILVLEDAIVTNCKGKDGGGLYAVLGSVEIRGTVFRNNEATQNSGGAFLDAQTTIENSVFEYNESNGSGGALVMRRALKMSGTRFIENVARDVGGALRLHASAEIDDCYFEKNRANSAGAVSVIAKTTIENSIFVKNEALTTTGGAIRVHGGQTLDIDESKILENSAHNGGAIFIGESAKLNISNCTLEGNLAESGAGLYIDRGTLRVVSSTLHDNNATDEGGGIYLTDSVGDVFRTTISKNLGYGGGGIYAEGSSLNAALTTIADNRATNGAGGIDSEDSVLVFDFVTIANNRSNAGQGGMLVTGSSVLSPRGSIFADNIGPIPNIELSASVTLSSSGYNLLGDLAGSGTACADWAATDLCEDGGVDPRLGDLDDNGGPTMTMLPAFNSLVVDAVPEEHCKLTVSDEPLTIDQRGLPRPKGSGCDIGAVEVQ